MSEVLTSINSFFSSYGKDVSKVLVALGNAKTNVSSVPRNGHNKHTQSRYMLLDDVMAEAKKVFGEQGLTHLCVPINGALEDGEMWGGVYWRLYVTDEPDSYLSGSYTIPVKGRNMAHEFGSANTYCARYTLTALLGLVGDEDDDGNAHGRPASRHNATNRKPVASRGAKKSSVPQYSLATIKTLTPDLQSMDEGSFMVTAFKLSVEAQNSRDMLEKKGKTLGINTKMPEDVFNKIKEEMGLS